MGGKQMSRFTKSIERIITSTILLRIVVGYSPTDIDEQIEILRDLANDLEGENKAQIKKATKK